MRKKFQTLRDELYKDPKARALAEEYDREFRIGLTLAQLREARQQTQRALAQRIHTTQSSVSRVENEADLYVSTLAEYIAGLGGELRIVASFPDGDIPIRSFAALAPSPDEEPVSAD